MRWLLLALAVGGCHFPIRGYYYGDNVDGGWRGYRYGYYTPGPYSTRGPYGHPWNVVVVPRILGPHNEVHDYFRRPGMPFNHFNHHRM